MSRRIRLALLLSFATAAPASSFAHEPPADAAPSAAPEQLLRDLYAAHRPWSDAALDLDDPAIVARWFCPAMQQAFAHQRAVAAACPEGELCGLDFDPILSAQDHGDGSGFDLQVEALPPPAQGLYAARFHVFGPEFDQTELHYRLARDGARWCVEDIIVPGEDGMSLKAHLESL
jgi:hypothetical protein